MKKFFAISALLLAIVLPAVAQGIRLSLSDQKRFDSYYSGWQEYRRTNNSSEVVSMEKRMQDVYRHYGIPAGTPYGNVASSGNRIGAGRPPTGIGTETVIGITGIGTETVIGTVIEIALGTAITIEIAIIRDYTAGGTNTIAIMTMTGTGIMTGITTVITIATMTMIKIMTMIADWQPE
jgi:hypothetical protein